MNRCTTERPEVPAKKHIVLVASLVAISSVAVYLRALSNDFVNWDDPDYVTNNLHIRSLNEPFLRWILTEFHSNNWHPLTWVSHALDYAIWGLNPLGHHLTNILLHGANAFLVVVLIHLLLHLSGMTSKRIVDLVSRTDKSLIVAGITGLIFGLHPLHVESVAWVSERKDLLCALFYLSSLIAYAVHVDMSINRSASHPRNCSIRIRYYLISLGCFVFALLSKPMAVSLPLVLLIIDWYFGRLRGDSKWKLLIAEKIPFFLLLCFSIVMTLKAQSGAIREGIEFPLQERILMGFRSLFIYLRNMLLPLDLSPLYPYPYRGAVSISSHGLYIILFFIVSIAAITTRKSHKLWLALWTFYLVTLLPVLGIVQVGIQAMADRYTYLPSLAPSFLLALGAGTLLDTAILKWKSKVRTIMAVASLIVVGIMTTLVYMTVKQIGVWKNGDTLWTRVISLEPFNAVLAYINRGNFLLEHARYQEALDDFNKGISLSTWGGGTGYLAKLYANRGRVYAALGKWDDAFRDFDHSVSLNEDNDALYFLRASMYTECGKYTEALGDLSKAIALKPISSYYNNRAILHGTLGQYPAALSDYEQAILSDPTSPDAFYNRGNLNVRMKRYEAALRDYTQAINLSADPSRDYFENRAYVYTILGRTLEARADHDTAAKLKR